MMAEKKARKRIIQSLAEVMNILNSPNSYLFEFKKEFNKWAKNASTDLKSIKSRIVEIFKFHIFVKIMATPILTLCILEYSKPTNTAYRILLAVGFFLLLLTMKIVSLGVVYYHTSQNSYICYLIEYFIAINDLIYSFNLRLNKFQNKYCTYIIHDSTYMNKKYGLEYRIRLWRDFLVSFCDILWHFFYGIPMGIILLIFCHNMQYDIWIFLEPFVSCLSLFTFVDTAVKIFNFIQQISNLREEIIRSTTHFRFWFENNYELRHVLQDSEMKSNVLAKFDLENPELLTKEKDFSFAFLILLLKTTLHENLSNDVLVKVISFLLYEESIELNDDVKHDNSKIVTYDKALQRRPELQVFSEDATISDNPEFTSVIKSHSNEKVAISNIKQAAMESNTLEVICRMKDSERCLEKKCLSICLNSDLKKSFINTDNEMSSISIKCPYEENTVDNVKGNEKTMKIQSESNISDTMPKGINANKDKSEVTPNSIENNNDSKSQIENQISREVSDERKFFKTELKVPSNNRGDVDNSNTETEQKKPFFSDKSTLDKVKDNEKTMKIESESNISDPMPKGINANKDKSEVTPNSIENNNDSKSQIENQISREVSDERKIFKTELKVPSNNRGDVDNSNTETEQKKPFFSDKSTLDKVKDNEKTMKIESESNISDPMPKGINANKDKSEVTPNSIENNNDSKSQIEKGKPQTLDKNIGNEEKSNEKIIMQENANKTFEKMQNEININKFELKIPSINLENSNNGSTFAKNEIKYFTSNGSVQNNTTDNKKTIMRKSANEMYDFESNEVNYSQYETTISSNNDGTIDVSKPYLNNGKNENGENIFINSLCTEILTDALENSLNTTESNFNNKTAEIYRIMNEFFSGKGNETIFNDFESSEVLKHCFPEVFTDNLENFCTNIKSSNLNHEDAEDKMPQTHLNSSAEYSNVINQQNTDGVYEQKSEIGFEQESRSDIENSADCNDFKKLNATENNLNSRCEVKTLTDSISDSSITNAKNQIYITNENPELKNSATTEMSQQVPHVIPGIQNHVVEDVENNDINNSDESNKIFLFKGNNPLMAKNKLESKNCQPKSREKRLLQKKHNSATCRTIRQRDLSKLNQINPDMLKDTASHSISDKTDMTNADKTDTGNANIIDMTAGTDMHLVDNSVKQILFEDKTNCGDNSNINGSIDRAMSGGLEMKSGGKHRVAGERSSENSPQFSHWMQQRKIAKGKRSLTNNKSINLRNEKLENISNDSLKYAELNNPSESKENVISSINETKIMIADKCSGKLDDAQKAAAESSPSKECGYSNLENAEISTKSDEITNWNVERFNCENKLFNIGAKNAPNLDEEKSPSKTSKLKSENINREKYLYRIRAAERRQWNYVIQRLCLVHGVEGNGDSGHITERADIISIESRNDEIHPKGNLQDYPAPNFQDSEDTIESTAKFSSTDRRLIGTSEDSSHFHFHPNTSSSFGSFSKLGSQSQYDRSFDEKFQSHESVLRIQESNVNAIKGSDGQANKKHGNTVWKSDINVADANLPEEYDGTQKFTFQETSEESFHHLDQSTPIKYQLKYENISLSFQDSSPSVTVRLVSDKENESSAPIKLVKQTRSYQSSCSIVDEVLLSPSVSVCSGCSYTNCVNVGIDNLSMSAKDANFSAATASTPLTVTEETTSNNLKDSYQINDPPRKDDNDSSKVEGTYVIDDNPLQLDTIKQNDFDDSASDACVNISSDAADLEDNNFHFETDKLKLDYIPRSDSDSIEVSFRRQNNKTKLVFKSDMQKLYVKTSQ